MKIHLQTVPWNKYVTPAQVQEAFRRGEMFLSRDSEYPVNRTCIPEGATVVIHFAGTSTELTNNIRIVDSARGKP